MSHVKLLTRAIAASGFDVRTFAATILGRSKSSVYRWLRGEQDIPAAVVTRLKTYLTSTTE